ncbi:MAG: hypothetical protein AAF666_08455 [Pseudomonadota bacterium]
MFSALSHRAALAIGGLQSSLFSTGASGTFATPGHLVRRGAEARRAGHAGDDAGWNMIADEAALRTAGGTIMHLFGQILDFDGRPVPGVQIELSQVGPGGPGQHTSEDPSGDGTGATDGFAGYGAQSSDEWGHYRFRTIRPVSDGTRPPLINARLSRKGGRVLETQLFLLGEPSNDGDWHYASLGPSCQAAVSIDPVARADGEFEAGFNFVL